MREIEVIFFFIIYFTTNGIFVQGDRNEKIKPDCTEKKCVAKCCPDNQLIVIKKYKDKKTNETIKHKECTNHSVLSFDDFPIFDMNFDKTGKKIREQFNLVGPDVMNITNFSLTNVAITTYYEVYVLDDGSLYTEVPNVMPKERWTYYNTSNYCIDYLRKSKDGELIKRYYLMPITKGKLSQKNDHLTAAMVISCVFLALVLVVYWLLPDLRNLRGLVLMSYVLSLFAAFTLLTTLNLLSKYNKSPHMVCKSFSFSFYFCMLSSFFWMNIMSLDIWWTFRGFAKVRMIHRRGEWFKYLVYCSYAWGVPLLMTGALIVLNETDMRHLPWFVTPQIGYIGCFIIGYSRLLYLYVPMMVLLVMNSVFFIMTVFNMWRLSRGQGVLQRAAVAAGRPSAHLSNRNRFIIYLKLSAVMGVNWLLEVISSLEPEWPIWYVTDIYNFITGIIIFFIFVCKKKIWRMLVNRRKECYREEDVGPLTRETSWRYMRHVNEGKRLRWLLRPSVARDLPTSASDSEVSQEMSLQCVSYNARGEYTASKR